MRSKLEKFGRLEDLKSQLVSSSRQPIDLADFSWRPPYLNRDFLQQKYVTERLGAREIGGLISSSKSTVLKHLKAFGIPVRPRNPGLKRRNFIGYGQRIENRKMVRHEREQIYLAKMEQLRSQGFTFEQIAQALNTLGIPTKTGQGKWHRKTVNALLREKEIKGKKRRKQTTFPVEALL